MKKVVPSIKRKKLALGDTNLQPDTYDLTGLTTDQIQQLNSFTDPAAKKAFYQSVKAPKQTVSSPVIKPGANALTTLANNAKGISDVTKTAKGLLSSGTNTDATLNNGIDDLVGKSDTGVASSGLSAGASAGIGIGASLASSFISDKTDTGRYAKKAIQRAGQGFAIAGPIGAGVGALEGLVENSFDEASIKKQKQQAEVQKNAALVPGRQADVNALKKGGKVQKKAAGGPVSGPGGPTDDLVETNLPAGSFVVPAKNASAAELIRKQYLASGGKAVKGGKGSGSVPVALSNGEHVFTPQEVKTLKGKGLNIDWLAPEASESYAKRNGGKIYIKKATGGEIEITEQPQKLAGGTTDVQPTGSFDSDKFSEDLLKELGLPVTTTRKAILKGWMQAEGNQSGTGFNPINTTLSKEGATIRKNKDGSANSAGVKDYASYEDGLKAIADTLKNTKAHPEYKKIIDGLKKQDITETYTAIAASPYGTRAGVLKSVRDQVVKSPDYATNLQKDAAIDKKADLDKIFDPLKNEQGVIAGYKPKAGDDYIIPKKFYTDDALAKKAAKPEADPLDVAASNETKQDAANQKQLVETLKPKTPIPGDPNEPGPDQVQQPVVGSRKTIQDLLDEEAGVGTMNVPVSTDPDGKVTTKAVTATDPARTTFDKLGGWGGAIALGQVGFGIANLASIGKRPVDVVDPMLIKRRNEAIADRWLNPAVKASAEMGIENDRRETTALGLDRSGGDVGAGTSAAFQSQLNSNKGRLGLAALEEEELAQKNARADSLTKDVASSSRRIFEDKLGAFEQNQKATADLIGAGLKGLNGAIDYKEQLAYMKKRDEMMYGSNGSNYTVPTNPNQ